MELAKLDSQLFTQLIKTFDYHALHAKGALELLLEQECTIPFVARYRKERTGSMNEQELRDLVDRYQELVEREKRRSFILEAIEKMEKMTPELKSKIEQAGSLAVLEDIYAPFKSKRKTKAQLARDYGLEPLATLLKSNQHSAAEMESLFKGDYVHLSEGKIKTFAQALEAAKDIVIEEIVHHVELKKALRSWLWENANLKSELKKEGDKHAESQKFKDFFNYQASLRDLSQKKAGHRYLAMRRGANLGILTLSLVLDEKTVQHLLVQYGLPTFKTGKGAARELLQNCLDKAWKNYLLDSLDLELQGELKKLADEGAQEVFAANLKQLLLAPYLGAKRVLGIDPGFRTGCKLAVVDETGKFLGDTVIYPHAPQQQRREAKDILQKLFREMHIGYVAIGNGTAGQETLELVQEVIADSFAGKVHAVAISEAGASVYSASPLAAKEFPELDVTVRGAISIARRFQDPLSELVKIDPKSIGVGQYQHDVNQSKLTKALEGVVEDCVNYVGVDLNTASFSILSYISGIGPTLAKSIVAYREKHQIFKNRSELLKVPRFSDKIFQQAAGFLRVEQGDHPFDSTFVHPEKYPVLEKWCQDQKISPAQLLIEEPLKKKLASDQQLSQEVGEETFEDIIKSLFAPKQDPRQEFKNVEFAKGMKDASDLQVGQWYPGVITNITMFGAFVNIGIKTNGLLHVSQMANEFVANPLDKFKVGQELKVKVLAVDRERDRISLSCRK